ncbi:hypothetical protein FVE85_4123 [Porphyridium purpureum]|uniref:Uncharacterized protein n=1 Tax=Porphyridium purpureum TaxID=35688 RepID=A0A5J4YS80_PORPP|nr:hypothetical protein FVE85_4123 [Porphyridium purpureum]|eukprot:POR9617..scf229_5
MNLGESGAGRGKGAAHRRATRKKMRGAGGGQSNSAGDKQPPRGAPAASAELVAAPTIQGASAHAPPAVGTSSNNAVGTLVSASASSSAAQMTSLQGEPQAYAETSVPLPTQTNAQGYAQASSPHSRVAKKQLPYVHELKGKFGMDGAEKNQQQHAVAEIPVSAKEKPTLKVKDRMSLRKSAMKEKAVRSDSYEPRSVGALTLSSKSASGAARARDDLLVKERSESLLDDDSDTQRIVRHQHSQDTSPRAHGAFSRTESGRRSDRPVKLKQFRRPQFDKAVESSESAAQEKDSEGVGTRSQEVFKQLKGSLKKTEKVQALAADGTVTDASGAGFSESTKEKVRGFAHLNRKTNVIDQAENESSETGPVIQPPPSPQQSVVQVASDRKKMLKPFIRSSGTAEQGVAPLTLEGSASAKGRSNPGSDTDANFASSAAGAPSEKRKMLKQFRRPSPTASEISAAASAAASMLQQEKEHDDAIYSSGDTFQQSGGTETVAFTVTVPAGSPGASAASSAAASGAASTPASTGAPSATSAGPEKQRKGLKKFMPSSSTSADDGATVSIAQRFANDYLTDRVLSKSGPGDTSKAKTGTGALPRTESGAASGTAESSGRSDQEPHVVSSQVLTSGQTNSCAPTEREGVVVENADSEVDERAFKTFVMYTQDVTWDLVCSVSPVDQGQNTERTSDPTSMTPAVLQSEVEHGSSGSAFLAAAALANVFESRTVEDCIPASRIASAALAALFDRRMRGFCGKADSAAYFLYEQTTLYAHDLLFQCQELALRSMESAAFTHPKHSLTAPSNPVGSECPPISRFRIVPSLRASDIVFSKELDFRVRGSLICNSGLYLVCNQPSAFQTLWENGSIRVYWYRDECQRNDESKPGSTGTPAVSSSRLFRGDRLELYTSADDIGYRLLVSIKGAGVDRSLKLGPVLGTPSFEFELRQMEEDPRKAFFLLIDRQDGHRVTLLIRDSVIAIHKCSLCMRGLSDHAMSRPCEWVLLLEIPFAWNPVPRAAVAHNLTFSISLVSKDGTVPSGSILTDGRGPREHARKVLSQTGKLWYRAASTHMRDLAVLAIRKFDAVAKNRPMNSCVLQ